MSSADSSRPSAQVIIGSWPADFLHPADDAVRVNVRNRTVTRGVTTVTLPTLRFRLLVHLLVNPDHVVSRAELVDGIWGWRMDGGPLQPGNCISVYLAHLRKALRALDLTIETVCSRGLMLSIEPRGSYLMRSAA